MLSAGPCGYLVRGLHFTALILRHWNNGTPLFQSHHGWRIYEFCIKMGLILSRRKGPQQGEWGDELETGYHDSGPSSMSTVQYRSDQCTQPRRIMVISSFVKSESWNGYLRFPHPSKNILWEVSDSDRVQINVFFPEGGVLIKGAPWKIVRAP